MENNSHHPGCAAYLFSNRFKGAQRPTFVEWMKALMK